jgi:hypothetical protein
MPVGLSNGIVFRAFAFANQTILTIDLVLGLIFLQRRILNVHYFQEIVMRRSSICQPGVQDSMRG